VELKLFNYGILAFIDSFKALWAKFEAVLDVVE
jgi:hypothetical protein